MANNTNMTYEDRVKNLERTIQEEAARKKSAPGETTWQKNMNSMYDDLCLIWRLMQRLKKAKLIPDQFISDLFDGDTEKDDTPLKIPNMFSYQMNRIIYNIRCNGTVYTLRLHGKKSGNIVEVYPSSDDPKVYNRIYGETKQFVHNFYAWFDKRFPSEENSDENLDT